jgi:hypothetical protein
MVDENLQIIQELQLKDLQYHSTTALVEIDTIPFAKHPNYE